MRLIAPTKTVAPLLSAAWVFRRVRMSWAGTPRDLFAGWAFSVYLLALASACGRPEARTADRDSTVVVAYPYEGGGDLLGPSDDEAMYLIFLPLLRYDENGNLEGRLARSWQHSDDYHEWTYRLRIDVRWHDGVHDDSTITIRAGDPEYYQTQVVHYPRHLLQHLDQSEMLDWPFWLEPVGNGAYRFVQDLWLEGVEAE